MNPRYLSAQALAEFLGMPNFEALEYARKDGLIPAPDTVFDKMPYWTIETAQNVLVEQANAIRNAFGHPDFSADLLFPGSEYGN